MVKVVGRAYVWVRQAGAVLFVLAGLLVAYLLQGPDAEAQRLQQRTERAALVQERFELESERTQTMSQFNQAQSALLIERARRLELEKILANVQSELGRTQDQLAFFEDLLPLGPQGGLDIRAVAVVPHVEGLHYRVLLMRGGKAAKPFVGALQFVAKGHCRVAGITTEQTIILQPLLANPLAQTEAQQAALRLEFVQFQRGQGLLALPPGFAPQSVTVRVLGGDIVLASRVVAL
jgi:hypothetical protein